MGLGRKTKGAQRKYEKQKLEKIKSDKFDLMTCGPSATKKRRLLPEEVDNNFKTCGPLATKKR